MWMYETDMKHSGTRATRSRVPGRKPRHARVRSAVRFPLPALWWLQSSVASQSRVHWGVMALLFVFSIQFFAQAQEPPVSVEFGPDSTVHDDKQQADERAQNNGVYNLRVRYVKVEGRWARPLHLPLSAGDRLTPEKMFEAMEAVRAAFTNSSYQALELRSKGEVGIIYVDVEYDTSRPVGVAPNTVGVIFRPFHLHFSLVKIGNNVLPIPRSPRPTFYENVPGPLLALKPTFGTTYDRAFGSALDGGIESDLLNLHKPTSHDIVNPDQHLDLQAQGSRSLSEVFYRAAAGLRYHFEHSGETLRVFGVELNYNGVREPLGNSEHVGNAGDAGIGLGLKLAPNTRLWLDTGYRYTRDRTKNDGLILERTHAHEQPNRVLFEAIPPRVHGFFRASVWQDNGWLTAAGGSYQRVVGRMGYAKEIPLAQNQALGLEVVAGAGTTAGAVPAHAQFFGGNSPGQFLYDDTASSALRTMPSGPLIRSFGEGQAGFRTTGGIRGGDSFWHVNINLSLPIPFPGWSRPLIPNEEMDLTDANGNPITIKQMLSKQVEKSGPNMLAAVLRRENPNLTPEQAAAQARQVFSEIEPATYYIINDANIYAIKPMLMFDAAGMSANGFAGQTWLAAGGGLQLTIVTAKLEIGYMRTVSGPTFGSRDNVFARLVFENLF